MTTSGTTDGTSQWLNRTSTLPSTNSWLNESNTTTAYNHANDQKDYYIGLALAILSSLFIGTSYILKKLGLIRAAQRTSVHASEGSVSYLRDWVWWVGMILMAVGEIANFVAYGFAPAMLVTPLGALSVIVSAILSSKFLHETLNLFGQCGCVLCLVGSTLIVVNAPQERSVTNMWELATMLYDPGFLVYVVLVVAGNIFMIAYCVPRWGKTNPLVYITITGSMGSLTVMACKSVGVALVQAFAGQTQVFAFWLTWMMLAIAAFFIVVQMNFLNRALDLFNTAIVSTILYIEFTTFVLIASALLFKEWGGLSATGIINIVCGFLAIVVAIFLISMFKEFKLGWRAMFDYVFKHKTDALCDMVTHLTDSAPDAGNSTYANVNEVTGNTEQPQSQSDSVDSRPAKTARRNKNNRPRRLSESISDAEPETPATHIETDGPTPYGANNGFANPAFSDEPLTSNDPLAVRFTGISDTTPNGTVSRLASRNAAVEVPIENGAKSPDSAKALKSLFAIENEVDALPNESLQSAQHDDSDHTSRLGDSTASRALFIEASPRKTVSNGSPVNGTELVSRGNPMTALTSSPNKTSVANSPGTPESRTFADRLPSYSSTAETDSRFSQGYSSRM